MVENSKIEWTDHTFNPWLGCTKISPGCDHCYAEAWALRYKTVAWGPGMARRQTSEANWLQPYKWDKAAAATGKRARVFCASLADVFDNEVPDEWRADLWWLIESTPNLDWLLLTKRIGNAKKMLSHAYDEKMPNIWLGASIVNQEEADRDIPKLLAVPARVRFLSMEPLLGPVDLNKSFYVGREGGIDFAYSRSQLIDWVIVGGESGGGARPIHPAWARSLRDQCVAAGVPFLFKQWGEWISVSEKAGTGEHFHFPDGATVRKIGKQIAGRELDGKTWDQVPGGYNA